MLCARDLMQSKVVSVAPTLSLPELEQQFLSDHVSGYPVLEGDRLVGIVSRSDVIRRLCVERSVFADSSDFYNLQSGASEDESSEPIGEIAARLGQKIEGLHVGDVMVRHLITVRPDHTIRHVAHTLVDNGIHRVLVTDDRRLLGVISSTDLVRLLADGRAVIEDTRAAPSQPEA